MNTIPQIPEAAPFSTEQRAWINGYLAGLFSGSCSASAPIAASEPSRGSLLFLYGSQTGTAEGLARRFAKEAKKRGYEPKVVGMESFATVDFAAEPRLALITSTYGDGEMPDNAQSFWDHLQGDGASNLSQTSYSVLALGDRNYTLFCEAGKRFDSRLAELGAARIHDRVECDVDYEEAANAWFEGFLARLNGGSSSTVLSVIEPEKESAADTPTFSKANPFPALLQTNRLLNGPESSKETRHFEISLAGAGLEYEVGDALGVVPRNCPDLVDEVLCASGLTGEETVAVNEAALSLREALISKFDLKPFLTGLPGKASAAEDLIAPLRKLQPRLYSISSSPKAHPGEVHLTVGIVRYEAGGRQIKGICSTYLADRVDAGGHVPVFVHKSPSFRLPADLSRPVIMVGPGTGIAPFRAFLEERRATGASGKNWLFFGDQRSECDFLYREELNAMQADGTLTRLDLAFSRDQEEKIYVQHRMLEQAGEFWAWLQDGASFYVCGDAKRMAKDVDAALHRVAEMAGGLSPDGAADFIAQLKTEKRYLRDVY